MSTAYPKISIIMPSYNQGKFIEEAILSVLEQDYPNLEFFIIDGGSTDSTLDIIKKYEKSIDYWVSEKDNGQSAAINKGFRMASGDIITWLCSDDTYLDGTLRYVGEFFTKNKNIDILYGDVKFIDHNGIVFSEIKGLEFSKTKYLSRIGSIPQPASFFRRELLQHVGFLDESLEYCMDYEFFGRIIFSGYDNIKHVNRFLATYRFHEDSKTVAGQNVHNGHQETMKKLQEKFCNENNYNVQYIHILSYFYKVLWVSKNLKNYVKYYNHYLKKIFKK